MAKKKLSPMESYASTRNAALKSDHKKLETSKPLPPKKAMDGKKPDMTKTLKNTTMADAMGKKVPGGKKKVKPILVKIDHGETISPDNSHEARWDLDTLTKAEQIKRDAKKMAAVKAEAKKQAQTLQSVLGKA